MKNNKYILAHDLGTGGNKAVLYDTKGNQLTKAFSSYSTYYPKSSWAEQYPDSWWNAVVKSTKELIQKSGINKKNIVCISFSGQSMGVVPVDKKGNLKRDTSPLWNDGRAINEAKNYLGLIGEKEWYKITGAGFRPENHSAFKLIWYKNNEYEMYKKTYKFLPTKSFIIMKLTDKFLADFSDISFTGFFNLEKLDYSDELLSIFKINREKLPDIFKSTHIAGKITKKASKEIELIEGTPVVLGGVDNSCAALGSGNISEDRVYNSLGSSAWISATTKRPFLNNENKVPCYAHVIPGFYLSQVSTFSAGSSYKWFKDILCGEESIAAEICDLDVYDLLEKKVLNSPIGSNKIIFNPSLLGGSTIESSPKIRGAFVGLGLHHSKNDLVRSVLEGIAMDQRLALDIYREMGIKAGEIRMVGGGSKSKVWRQIYADVFNSKIIITNIGQEAAALGAGIIGAIGVGVWDNFSIIDKITKIIDICEPIEKNVSSYEEILKVFKFINIRLAEIGEEMIK